MYYGHSRPPFGARPAIRQAPRPGPAPRRMVDRSNGNTVKCILIIIAVLVVIAILAVGLYFGIKARLDKQSPGYPQHARPVYPNRYPTPQPTSHPTPYPTPSTPGPTKPTACSRDSDCGANQACGYDGVDLVCHCKQGFHWSIDGRGVCIDVDECATANGNCEGTCTNTYGSYMCACPAGSWLTNNGFTCEDVDECATANGNCEGTCTNTYGSYTCACPAGSWLTNNGFTCKDLNECLSGPCMNGGCDDLINGYKCVCNPGYTGTNCELGLAACSRDSDCGANQACGFGGVNRVCNCKQGFHWSTDGSGECIDVDECATANGNCEGTCTNSHGSYTCACPDGYEPTSNGFTCEDLNECMSGPCVNGGGCEDLINGYKCACNPDYTGTNCEFELCDTDGGYVYSRDTNRCYRVYYINGNWHDSEKACVQEGGHLVSINTDEERVFLDAYIASMPHSLYYYWDQNNFDLDLWVGLYVEDASNPSTWTWTDESTEKEAIRWESNSPTNDACAAWDSYFEDTATLTRDFLKTRDCDIDYDWMYGFICEKVAGGK